MCSVERWSLRFVCEFQQTDIEFEWLSLNSEGGLNMTCDAIQQIFMTLWSRRLGFTVRLEFKKE